MQREKAWGLAYVQLIRLSTGLDNIQRLQGLPYGNEAKATEVDPRTVASRIRELQTNLSLRGPVVNNCHEQALVTRSDALTTDRRSRPTHHVRSGSEAGNAPTTS